MIGFRKVEGEIFRLGMLLEDIQEQTDDCKYSLAPSLISDESAHSSNPLWEVILRFIIQKLYYTVLLKKISKRCSCMFSSNICKA